MKIYQLLFIMLFLSSCNEFLDKKPNQKMVVPKTLTHADLLLNDYSTMNTVYPSWGQIASDDSYLSTANWQSLSDADEKQTYIWADDDIMSSMQWQSAYKAIYQANQVLKILADIDSKSTGADCRRVEGGAYFFRAFAFHQLAVVYAPPYESGKGAQALGIPLKLDPELGGVSLRASLEDTYNRIVDDYKKAITLLPATETKLGRPTKAAAYAGLARVYLDMSEFQHAFNYAGSALEVKNYLLDFNDLAPGSSQPISRFNSEVIFPASTTLAGALSQYSARVDTGLLALYNEGDLRKIVFFQAAPEGDGSHLFKGSYDGSDTGIFVGLTTGETLLIRAEAAVRLGKIQEALSSLNTLLNKRWSKNSFSPITETNPDRLLKIILQERRKELPFRGRRWADLKRLNLDASSSTTLKRIIDGRTYTLEPNSLKYAIKIPKTVIDQSGMTQNQR
ncbi:RagB/SusD family nutrient uptake outer membrane protein [uncultured Sphingobacterium sp.]|uniref:RagB/SusD family nutrient uptake outer membrane protein n=1 Tax=uncultured Sphingobacterium sp. TaxID=182688 RepID=UPI0025EA994A|nr:RagB/SusD family nutrient uptake outer membrane protein [uncultured Sphingobacterium sp.]